MRGDRAIAVARCRGKSTNTVLKAWTCNPIANRGLEMVKENPQVTFYFVSVWNGGEDGHAMLQKFQIADQPNVTILADPGPRAGNKIKQFAGLPLSWIPTTWIYKGGDLRYALNYGEVRFDVLRQFIEDSNSEWSHKGESANE